MGKEITMNYDDFLKGKQQLVGDFGFEPLWFPDIAFDFQRYGIEKAVRKGRMANFYDTGLGKTLINLSIAYNTVLHTNKKVLILTPLAVAFQFIDEANKIGIDDIEYTRDGKHTKKIVLCNYERLHLLNPDDFISIHLDESSILKNFNGKIRKQITIFARRIKYRQLFTATPSPNDYTELGTSSEVLGVMDYMEVLRVFFANNENNIRPQEIATKWYLKPHAKDDFFSWINQWAVMAKMPSDLGFSDEKYKLPQLIKNVHSVKNDKNWVIDGQHMMFNYIAQTMTEVKQEQKMTIENRVKKAIELADKKNDFAVYWVNFNDESKMLRELDKSAVEIIGSQSIEQKEEILKAFADGEIKRLITKARMTGMGLNWQHCNHTIFFPTWSYEQYYQAIRRFWRFGQKREVTVDLVVSDGQKRVIEALDYKIEKANDLYQSLINAVNKEVKFEEREIETKINLPKFI